MSDLDRLPTPCRTFEPHIWKRSKCKNCFHTKSDHKKYPRSMSVSVAQEDDPTALHLDFVDGPFISEQEDTPRTSEIEVKTKKERKDELKFFRKERKDIATKQSELRETMLRMEVQMHDYKETKLENDILTKDIQLMKRDLREVTIGAAKACEVNESLRKEIFQLRNLVKDLGGDPRDISSNVTYDSESFESDSPQIPRPVNRRLSIVKEQTIEHQKRYSKEFTEVNLLARSQQGAKQVQLEEPSAKDQRELKLSNRNERERVARIEDLLSSLRSVCISISNTPPNVSKHVLLSFVENTVSGLEKHCLNFVRKLYQRALSTPEFSVALRKSTIQTDTELPPLSELNGEQIPSVTEILIVPTSPTEIESPEDPSEQCDEKKKETPSHNGLVALDAEPVPHIDPQEHPISEKSFPEDFEKKNIEILIPPSIEKETNTKEPSKIEEAKEELSLRSPSKHKSKKHKKEKDHKKKSTRGSLRKKKRESTAKNPVAPA